MPSVTHNTTGSKASHFKSKALQNRGDAHEAPCTRTRFRPNICDRLMQKTDCFPAEYKKSWKMFMQVLVSPAVLQGNIKLLAVTKTLSKCHG